MMRNKLFQLASLLLLAAGCSQEDFQHTAPGESIITATMETAAESRSHATDEGKFTWTKGDKISVYTSSGNFRTFTLQGEGGTATADFAGELQDGECITQYAIYPQSDKCWANGNSFILTLPAEYGDFETEYVPNTNAPMVAALQNTTQFNFKHLGGVLRFNLDNVPAGSAQFVFTAADKDITGTFTSDILAETPSISEPYQDGGKSVTIKFKPLETVQNNMTFFVPLPTGTYNGFTIAMKDKEGTTLAEYKHNKTNTMNRKALARFPKVTLEKYVEPELVKVEYRRDWAWIEPHDNLALSVHPVVYRDRIYSNGNIETDFYTPYGCVVTSVVMGNEYTEPEHFEVYDDYGNVAYTDIIEFSDWEIIRNDSCKIYRQAIFVPNLDDISVSDEYDHGYKEEMNLANPGNWEKYLLSKPYEPEVVDGKALSTQQWGECSREYGWYTATSSRDIDRQVKYKRVGISGMLLRLQYPDFYLSLDGLRIDFEDYWPQHTVKLITEDIPASGEYSRGKKFTHECRTKWCGRNFYLAVEYTVYERK